MTDYAIITLNIGGYTIDMELPRFMKIGDMQQQMLLLLGQNIPSLVGNHSKILLLYNGKVLDEAKDMAFYKICTGAILEGICK